jgi:2-polyprenyl-3-methyl-5-hydroxy-6-metoxy-1,4-benzoquinol methylase
MNKRVTKCIICDESHVTNVIKNDVPLLLCTKCHLLWRVTFDVADSFYEYNEVSLRQESLDRRLRNVRDRIRLLEKYISGNNFCDIGAGEGMFVRELVAKGYTNVVGIEPNTGAVHFAETKGIPVMLGTLENVPEVTKERGIHTISLFHVIEHLPDPLAALTKIYDSLQVGDHVVLETPNIHSFVFKRTHYVHPLIYPEHLYYFDTENLPQLLEKVGFKIVAKGKRGFDHYNLSIRHALFYLGIGSSPYVKKKEMDGPLREVRENNDKDSADPMLRRLLRKTLSALVVLLGRVDYQWVIARK